MSTNHHDILKEVCNKEPVFWVNNRKKVNEVLPRLILNFDHIKEAEERLKRFAPLIKRLFKETENGIIESPLIKANKLKHRLENFYANKINGELYLKCDNYLKVAGSIKARGGIYEVLKHAEDLAIAEGILDVQDDYAKLANEEFRELFSKYKIAVGSTGNLGMSIGIMSAALGFKAYVHMSRDAKQWKKELLREKGVTVIEYNDDYSKAVEEGRKQCENDPLMHFVDDENSKDLFLGYSIAALRLQKQLESQGVFVDENHKLYVYLPCGVGGAPGGITFGLKHVYGDNVKCYFVEPIEAPCMLLGLLSGKGAKARVADYGLTNITEADGLAVGSPSELVCSTVGNLIDGIYTIQDNELFKLLTMTMDEEGVKAEPSAVSSILGPIINKDSSISEQDIHIAWLTGGLFVPEDIYKDMYKRGQQLIKE